MHQVAPKRGVGRFWSALPRARLADESIPELTPRVLGQASAAMTLDTYADLFEDDLDAVSDRMNQAGRKRL